MLKGGHIYIPTLYSDTLMRQIIRPQITQLQTENQILKAKIAKLETQLKDLS